MDLNRYRFDKLSFCGDTYYYAYVKGDDLHCAEWEHREGETVGRLLHKEPGHDFESMDVWNLASLVRASEKAAV